MKPKIITQKERPSLGGGGKALVKVTLGRK